MRVSIVHGGTSTEEAVSTRNALHVKEILVRLGHETDLVPYNRDMPETLRLKAPDAVFICVQGKGHGDGTIQAMLDFLKLPYTGTHTLGAAIINDKIVSKELFEGAGILTPPWQSLSLADFKAGNFDFSPIDFPLVAKAPTQGGSFGIELIKSAEDIPKIESVFAYDDPILIEKFIYGRFVTLGLLQRNGVLETFPPVEKESDPPTPKSELVLVNSRFIFKPSDLPERIKTEIDALGRRAFKVSRAKGYARIDFMVSEADGRPYVLEINAVPGLKHGSLYPYGAGLRGFNDEEIIGTILRNTGPED
jgi:D-alanine-D-alanine ligase/UDP-N-acetylmuramate--alanine ligase